MQAWKKRFQKKNLNEQMRIFFAGTVVIMMAVIIAVSTVSSVSTLYRKSSDMQESQLHFVARSYQDWLGRQVDLATALMLDETVQEYCQHGNMSIAAYQEIYDATKEIISSYLNVNEDVNFIAVIDQDFNGYVYAGNHSVTTVTFMDKFIDAYEKSWQAEEAGSFRMLYQYSFFKNETSDTVTFFQPVYSTDLLNTQIGLLCINVDDSLLGKMQKSSSYLSSVLSITDLDGTVLTSTDYEKHDPGEKMLASLSGTKGTVREQGRIFFYQKVSGWNAYVFSEMSVKTLYESAIRVIVLLIVIILVLMFIMQRLIRKIIDKSYEPIQTVVDAMDALDEYRLNERIGTENMGTDIKKLGDGYNRMMDEIQVLLEKVKDEEKQMSQIRLDALQSQIQPHFLYNTLECIHWQSIVEGNQEASTLVKALARYYRICLSKGKDVVPLSTELEHIQLYLLIQNKRFGDVVTCQVDIPENLMQNELPKITLQPLVENCLYHGIGIKAGHRGTVSIAAHTLGEDYIVEVSDDGDGLPETEIMELNSSLGDFDAGHGYGVKNVNRRIELMFGESYGLTYRANASGGLTAEIRLPISGREGADNV